MDSIDIIICDEEDLSKTLIESYLSELNFKYNINKYNELNLNLVENNDNYKIIIVNITGADNKIFEQISACSMNKKNKLIAMSYNGSANLQVRAFRAGIKDFLVKPLIKTDCINSIGYIYQKYFSKEGINANSKVFTAISNRKGDGKSGFLINLAMELADISNEKVLLIDFNNSQDNISFLLNADIIHNTNYYVNNLTEDNAQALLSTVTKYKNSNLYIMANSFIKNKSIEIKKDKLDNAVNILKNYFKYILIDRTPEDCDIDDEMLSRVSNEVFCLILPIVSSLSKIKNLFENYYKDKNIKIVLMQYTVEDEAKIEQIQTLLGREVFWKIPKNFTAFNNALNNNITLKESAEGTNIVNSYMQLAKFIVNRE